MSASLVGSEMCIRDSSSLAVTLCIVAGSRRLRHCAFDAERCQHGLAAAILDTLASKRAETP
eukprot:3262922-Alexandrium_andersonii.AAC.1